MSIHVEGKPFNLPLSHSRLESLRSAGLRRTDRSDQLFAFSTLEEPKQRKLSIKLLKSPENKDQEVYSKYIYIYIYIGEPTSPKELCKKRDRAQWDRSSGRAIETGTP